MADSLPVTGLKIVEKHEAWTSAGPVLSHISDSDISVFRERAVITTASPSTVGWWAFATGTWMSATVLGGFLGWADSLSAAPTVLLFAGMTQFIAGLYGFRRASVLHATIFCSFGTLNNALGLMFFLQVTGAVKQGTGAPEMIGFLLESFAFIALALAWASLRRNALMFGVLAFICAGYAIVGVSQFMAQGSPAGVTGLGVIAAAGAALMFASSFLAYYLGTAMLVNSTWNRSVLPIPGLP